MADRLFTLDSGRGLGISASGDPVARRLVLVCHPTPGAGGFDPDPVVTGSWGVHLLSIDRPGYGVSEALPPFPSPTIEDRADDLAEYVRRSEDTAEKVNRVDFGAVGVVGWGTGGAVALSFAARNPDLVDRAAIVGTPAPRSSRLRKHNETALEARSLSGNADVAATIESLSSGAWSRPDALGIHGDDPALQKAGVDLRLQHMLDEAVLHGPAGIATDLVALQDHSWAAASALGEITASVKLVYGDDDPVASADVDGHWFGSRVPDSSVVRVAGAGRLAIVSAWSQILSHVAPQHGGIGSPSGDR